MKLLKVPEPTSVGLFLTYKCSGRCQHCMYACSPHWKADWLSLDDAEVILSQLAPRVQRGSSPGWGFDEGIHIAGGEPFLNFSLLVQVTALARRIGISSVMVETNAFWATDDESALEKLTLLREAGLQGIMISTNPFVVEHVPFSCTQRAVRMALQVFPYGVMVYQRHFYEQLRQMGLQGTLPLDGYLAMAGNGLASGEVLARGRLPFALSRLFRGRPAQDFVAMSCAPELLRDWHVHIDNYGNYVPGYCGGLSFGDGRNLDRLCQGIDLDELPVLRALLTNLGELLALGLSHGYPQRETYASKCHLCADIRRYLLGVGDFAELRPRQFYEQLEG